MEPLFGRSILLALAIGCWSAALASPAIRLERPVTPPAWALLQRQLLAANAAACREFFARYFDERGRLLCVERWGGDDGPDDAIENLNDWPILCALGGDADVLALLKKGWEGHLRQYTEARTRDVPFARDGMYYKEFPVMFDWLHNGEGLSVFNLLGLADPEDLELQKRVRRFAGFYMNDDPGAPNYDAERKIIRSLFNGSRGPLLRKATALDWAGDPIEVENRFRLGHGERSYEEMLAHFKDYNDIVGDHPLNLLATSLALNAHLLAGEERYRAWLLEYVGAWRDRMEANGWIIPTKIGLDGVIGGAAGGRWWGGVYGWGFSVVVPQTGELAHRNLHHLGFVGFANAYFLTGDDRYLDAWRRQMDAINAQARQVDGKREYPRMHGEKGWYDFGSEPYSLNALELYYLSQRREDRARAGSSAWLEFLDGRNPSYPEEALRRDLDRIRSRIAAMRLDPTTPDTRLADDPMRFNPASVDSLIELQLGGIHPGHRGSILHARLRYFDPLRRRAGLPPDVAALVDRLDGSSAALTLVNLDQLEPRELVLQAGAYGEHRLVKVEADGRTWTPQGAWAAIELAPGAGARLQLAFERYAHPPRLAFPWRR
jgi:hypothetical protein